MHPEVKRQLDAVAAQLRLGERGPVSCAVVVLVETAPCAEHPDDASEDHNEPHVVVSLPGGEPMTVMQRYWALSNALAAVHEEMDEMMYAANEPLADEDEAQDPAERPN